MHRIKSIGLLILVISALLPWEMVCLAHPLGHSQHHHDYDGPSPCEMRKAYKGSGPVWWPPMECKHLSEELSDFNRTHFVLIENELNNLRQLTEQFTITILGNEHPAYVDTPEPQCRSATLSLHRQLRAPPII